MKKTILLLLLISFIKINSQTIFEYEREINEKENFNFKEIEFRNTDENFTLSGTLITPKSSFDKLIVLVPGSGKDTRYSHPKLTEKLLESNIAVYRFDERGIGKSGGNYSSKVSTLKNDLNFCLNHLKSENFLEHIKIGVLGHSLGGMASIGILEFKTEVDFFIQMSTPVNAGESFKSRVSEMPMIKTTRKPIAEIEKLIDTFNYVIKTTDDFAKIKKQCEKITRKMDFPRHFPNFYINPTFVDIIKLDTEFYYENVGKPLLFIIGEKDKLVNVKFGTGRLEEFKNNFISIEIIENMDHYLTRNEGSWNVEKKSEIREIDDVAVSQIIDWIEKNN